MFSRPTGPSLIFGRRDMTNMERLAFLADCAAVNPKGFRTPKRQNRRKVTVERTRREHQTLIETVATKI